MPILKDMQHVHFIGIGGIGISALARLLLGLGVTVSGSDRSPNRITQQLQEEGATFFPSHAAEQITGAELVVYSGAVPKDNPEYQAALEAGILLWHRAELLAAFMKETPSVAITGTHGKSTCTAMLAQILITAGLDPTVIIGGEFSFIGSNAKLGQGNILVAEVDESDGSFLQLAPTHAILTNMEWDHLDHYPSLEAVVAACQTFLQLLPPQGIIVLGNDCPQVAALAPKGTWQGRQVIRSGTQLGEGTASQVEYHRDMTSFLFSWQGTPLGKVSLHVPGKHNVQNATSCLSMALALGVSFPQAAVALENFRGVDRRLQLVGQCREIAVYDDYAHHPSEIRAILAASRQLAGERLVVAFQPHLYSRTHLLLSDFALALATAD
ncbi:MAG: UDP-N-acetylmuramate--L-alanine ligase, partial [Symbiobacteriaceae bacterium]|nr:UDP-N-acetylmuramate--L-alanine ligase [Symbiobacteriaceae bacterium]